MVAVANILLCTIPRATLPTLEKEHGCSVNVLTMITWGQLSFGVAVLIDCSWLVSTSWVRLLEAFDLDMSEDPQVRLTLTPVIFRLQERVKARSAESISRSRSSTAASNRSRLSRRSSSSRARASTRARREEPSVDTNAIFGPEADEPPTSVACFTREELQPPMFSGCAIVLLLGALRLSMWLESPRLDLGSLMIFSLGITTISSVMLGFMWNTPQLTMRPSGIEDQWELTAVHVNPAIRAALDEDDAVDLADDDAPGDRTVRSLMTPSSPVESAGRVEFAASAPAPSARPGVARVVSQSGASYFGGEALPPPAAAAAGVVAAGATAAAAAADEPSCVLVRERLEASSVALPLARLHAMEVTIPALSGAAEAAQLEIAVLLQSTNPKAQGREAAAAEGRKGGWKRGGGGGAAFKHGSSPRGALAKASSVHDLHEQQRLFAGLAARGEALLGCYGATLRALEGVVASHGEGSAAAAVAAAARQSFSSKVAVLTHAAGLKVPSDPVTASVGDAAAQLAQAELDRGLFKASKAKKLMALAPLSTNLQVHTVTLRRAHALGREGATEVVKEKGEEVAVKEKNFEEGEAEVKNGWEKGKYVSANDSIGGGIGDGDGGDDDDDNGGGDEIVVTNITFGAPAAHALKFKQGGLRTLAAKAAASEGFPPREPDAIMTYLELKGELACREAVVVGQALGGCVAAAGEAVRAAVGRRDSRALGLWGNEGVGMLVHAVNLLSTQGDEQHMIDDFVGGWARLDVTLQLFVADGAPLGAPGVADGAAAATASSGDGGGGERGRERTWGGRAVTVHVAGLDAGGQRTRRAGAQGGGAVFPRPYAGDGLQSGRLAVRLQLRPPEAHAWAVAALGGYRHGAGVGEVQLVPVLFNLGVNELQTVRGVLGRLPASWVSWDGIGGSCFPRETCHPSKALLSTLSTWHPPPRAHR